VYDLHGIRLRKSAPELALSAKKLEDIKKEKRERLWGLAKKTFGRLVMGNCKLDSQAQVQAFVTKSIAETDSESLKKYVVHCYAKMICDLEAVN
jgi:hypothetical protein